MTNLESFYNLYFRADEKIVMMFPHSHDERVSGMIPARICPDCLQVKLGEDGTDECVNCEMCIRDRGTVGNKTYAEKAGLSFLAWRSGNV